VADIQSWIGHKAQKPHLRTLLLLTPGHEDAGRQKNPVTPRVSATVSSYDK